MSYPVFNHERRVDTDTRKRVSMVCQICGNRLSGSILMRRVYGHIERLNSPVRVTITRRCSDCHSLMVARVRVGQDRKIMFTEIRPFLGEIGTGRKRT